MSSYSYGKAEVRRWVLDNFPAEAEILDVGACDGIWRFLLPRYENMDAVEIFGPSAERLIGYRRVFHTDIAEFPYLWYDLIIFGDVIEHMTVARAKAVLDYASTRCRDMIVAVPYLYEQDEIYGNPWEKHLQPDLTPEIFAQRYPQLTVLHDTGMDYCYYHKRGAP